MRASNFKAQTQCSEVSDFFACIWILCHWPFFLVQTAKCLRFPLIFLRHFCSVQQVKNGLLMPLHSMVRLVFWAVGGGIWNTSVFPGWVIVHFYTWKKYLLIQRRCTMQINMLRKSQYFFQLFTLTLEVWSKLKRIRRKALCSDLGALNILTELLLPSIWPCSQAVEVCVVL